MFKQVSGAAVSVNNAAQFTMDGGAMFGEDSRGEGVPNCDTSQKGIFASGAARVTVRNGALIQNLAGGALDLTGQAQGILDGAKVVSEYTDGAGPNLGCAPAPSIRTLDFASVSVQNSSLKSDSTGSPTQADGIRALTGVVVVKNSSIEDYASDGIEAGSNVSLIDVGGSTLVNQTDVNAPNATQASIGVRDSKLNGNRDLVVPSVRMRDTSLAGNTGIVLTGSNADLGTASDPGLNSFQDTTLTGVRYDTGVASGLIKAVGNSWHPGEQGADAFGFYPSVTISGAASAGRGRNFQLASSEQRIELGPVFVGRLELSPRKLRARVGRTAALRVGWTHPRSWKELKTVELRLYRGAKRVGRVTVRPASRGVSRSGAVSVVRRATKVKRSGRTVTAKLGLRFAPRLARARLRVDVRATNREGRVQVEKRAGRVTVAR